MQCTARVVAVHCGDGCSALRGRLQCTASEMGKTGTEIVSPILDKRKGRRDAPVSPTKYRMNHEDCYGRLLADLRKKDKVNLTADLTS